MLHVLKLHSLSCYYAFHNTESSRVGPLTIRVQQSGDPQLPLRGTEGLLQVLPVAPGPGLGQVHQVGPQGVLDGQEDHAAPPAGLEILHVDWAAGSEGIRSIHKYIYTQH